MNPLEPTDLADRVFGQRFKVKETIGTGAHAEVFVAIDQVDGQQVALKVFDQAVGEDPNLADQVVALVDKAATVDHPSVVKIIDRGLDGVRLWVASELCVGSSLRSLLNQGELLTPSQALVMSLECARSLEHLHANGLVHRGIKPENVLFSADQRVRLTDIGLSEVLSDTPLARSGYAVDYVRYISPEQASDAAVGGAADLYSLALVTSEAVSGTGPPSADTSVGTRSLRANSPAELDPQLGSLRAAFERCVRLDPDDRPETEELTIALLAAAESMPRPGPLPLVLISVVGQEMDDPEAVGESINEQIVDGGVVDGGVVDSDVVDVVDGSESAAAMTPAAIEPAELANLEATQVDPTNTVDSPDHQVGPDTPTLVAVPDVASEVDSRVALDDLSLAEPSFVEPVETPDETQLDIPLAAGGRQSSPTLRQDAEDLDEHLPTWPLFILMALVAAGVMAWLLFGSVGADGEAAVPDLVGADSSVLDSINSGGQWTIETLEIRQNGSTAGSILDQDPASGENLAIGETLTVTVSLGSEMVEIPNDVAGLSLAQAQDRLAQSGLIIGVVTEEFSESVEQGLVIDIDEPTRQKPAGDAVALRVSTGPDERLVPDVIGQTIGDATALLTGLRLQVQQEPTYDEFAEAGTVLRSTPGAGESVAADTQVLLHVSQGPEPVEIPELAELSLADARAIIESLGLVFADAEGSPGDPVGSSIPPAGTEVDVGTEVTLALTPLADEDEDQENG